MHKTFFFLVGGENVFVIEIGVFYNFHNVDTQYGRNNKKVEEKNLRGGEGVPYFLKRDLSYFL